MEALRVAFSMIFWVFVKSGNQRLDCTCAVRLGFGPLVSTLWASIGALCFFNVFLTCFGVIPGSQKVPKNQVSLKWVSSESQVSLKWASSEPQVSLKWTSSEAQIAQNLWNGNMLKHFLWKNEYVESVCFYAVCYYVLDGLQDGPNLDPLTGAAQTLFLSFSRAVSVRRICDILCILYILCTSMYAYACTSMHMHAYSLRALWRHCLKFVNLFGVFFQSWTFSEKQKGQPRAGWLSETPKSQVRLK